MKKIFTIKNIALILAIVLLCATFVSCRNSGDLDINSESSSETMADITTVTESEETTVDNNVESDSETSEITTESETETETETETDKLGENGVREGTDDSEGWGEFEEL